MVVTFFVYNFMLCISVLLAWLSRFINNKNTRLFLYFCVGFTLFIVAALRYRVGADYDSYVAIYYNINAYTSRDIEWGFLVLNRYLNLLGFSAQSIFVATSAIIALVVVLAGIKINRLDLVVLAYIIIFYLNSLNAVRQEVAVAILIYSIACLLNGENWKFLCLVFVASSFHVISLCLLPLVFFNGFKYSKWHLFITIIVAIILFRMSVVSLIVGTGLLSGTRYEVYLNWDIYNSTTNLGSGLGLLFRYSILLVAFLLPKRLYNASDLKLRNITLLLNSLLLLSVIVSLNFYIFHRFVSLFSIALLLSLILISKAHYKWRQIVLLVIIIMNLVYFENDIQTSQKSVGGNKAVSPYTTIISE